jgi:D-ribose pyranase
VAEVRDHGLWHAELVGRLLSLRHHDTVVIADAGLPVPASVATIDLGWQRGEPRVVDVLAAVVAELVVETATIAKDLADAAFLVAALAAIPVDRITHEELKAVTAGAQLVVRTGDDTPFANVVLHAGVPFGPTPSSHGGSS